MSVREKGGIHANTILERCGWAKLQAFAEDVEMQQQQTPPQNVALGHCHMTALQCLFGLSEEELNRWPGMTAYCKYLEKNFQPLIADEYSYLWTAIGKERPLEVERCWPWFNLVTSTIRSMKDEDSSIEDVWNNLITPPSGSNIAMPNTSERAACLIAVFSVLCWCTMALQPKLSGSEINSSPSLLVHQQYSDQHGLKMDTVCRPIPAIFRQFRRTMVTSRWRQPIGSHSNSTQHSTALYVSSLNYASLKMFGKVQLAWVDNLTSHLDFDSTNRRLSIFKFPSYCAISALKHSDVPPVFMK
jgi:hypothetical protein